MAMKKVKSKKRPSQPIQTTTTNFGSSQELNSFSVAAAILEAASAPTQISPSRKFLSTITSPLRKSNPSQVSLATSNSFATANERESNTPAASYFVDSSDDETRSDQGCKCGWCNSILSECYTHGLILNCNHDISSTLLRLSSTLFPQLKQITIFYQN